MLIWSIYFFKLYWIYYYL